MLLVIFHPETWGQFEAKHKDWHKWFAWHPVRIDGAIVWLQTIERRCAYIMHRYYDGSSAIWEYRFAISREGQC